MTAKFDSFIKDLYDLCIAHDVMLDLGYDGIEVFDNPINPSDPPDRSVHNVLYGGIGNQTIGE